MARIACIWCKNTKQWETNSSTVCSNIGNPFIYLAPELGGHELIFLDTGNRSEEEMRRVLEDERPDILLLSVLTPGVDIAWRIIRGLRAAGRPVIDIWGGWHCFCSAEELVREGATIVVKGPGENVIAEICANPGNYRGVIDARGYPRIWTVPQRNLFGSFFFIGAASDPHRAASLSVIRGCRRSCRFCAASKTEIEIRPKDYLEKDLGNLRDNGVNTIFLVDDNPMAYADQFVDLCSSIEKVFGPKKPRWRAYGDSSADIGKIADPFVASGGINICIGLETPDAALLENYGAHIKQLKAKPVQAFSRWREAGVYVTTSVIVGDPRFRFDREGLIDCLNKAVPDTVTVFQLMPVKGSLLWDDMKPYLRDDITYGDLDQGNPLSFYKNTDIDLNETTMGILSDYYLGEAYQGLIEARIRQKGKESYLRDVAVTRNHLLRMGIDPWHRYLYAVPTISNSPS